MFDYQRLYTVRGSSCFVKVFAWCWMVSNRPSQCLVCLVSQLVFQFVSQLVSLLVFLCRVWFQFALPKLCTVRGPLPLVLSTILSAKQCTIRDFECVHVCEPFPQNTS